MSKKQFFNKLNNEKGITGADIVVSMLIILTTIGVIASVYTNLVIGSKEVDRKTGATRIVTNILENISMIYYDEIDSTLQTFVSTGYATKENSTYTIAGGENVKIFETTIPVGYTVIIDIANSYGSQTSLKYDLVKKVNVKTKYLVNGQPKQVAMSKVFEREVVRECNSPNFSDDYIKQMVGEENYIMYSATAKDAAGVKVICPIQYDNALNAYKIITDTNSIWYSYSSKQWARALVLEPSEVENVITQEVLKGEDSYVWVPRYGVQAGGDLLKNTYFKYKTTNYAISNSYGESDLTYNYINTNPITWSTNWGISDENLLGKWCKYSDLTTIGKDAYNLNNSRLRTFIGILEFIGNS